MGEVPLYRGNSKLRKRTPPGWSYAPRHSPTEGSYGGFSPYFRVTPVLQGPRGVRFIISEVPLYPHTMLMRPTLGMVLL